MFLSTGVIILITLLNIIVYYLRPHLEEEDYGERMFLSAELLSDNQCRRFSLAEIKAATQNFTEANIADVLTTPRDACQLSLVSKLFHSAAESEAVWQKFLPSDYRHMISRSINPESFPQFSTTKQLYLHLSEHPLIIDGGTKSFSLDKQSGKKCYMLAPRSLSIAWGENPQYWTWTSLPNARFEEVAELRSVWWLHVHGNISISLLSPDTNYAAYLVYKLTADAYGFDLNDPYAEVLPAEVSVGMIGEESEVRLAALKPEGRDVSIEQEYSGTESSGQAREADVIYPKERKNGWLEVELGEYFNKGEEDVDLELSLKEVKAQNNKGGLIVQGIEIRPKEVNNTT